MTMHSMESAISSRVTREYRIPSWPMAMPSHTPITGNCTGMPPASRTPSAAALAMESRCRWPGTISLLETAMPISGLSNSSSINPSALNRDRWGALATPFLTLSLRIITSCQFSSRACNTAFPIASVPTIFSALPPPPLRAMSLVRSPASRTAWTAPSTASASVSRPKE